MDIKIYVKDNILYFDYGYVKDGDIKKVTAELVNYLKDISSPFQTISIYERAIEKQCLPLADETAGIRSFSDYLEKCGRDLSVWVISENNLLYKSLNNIAQNKESVRIAQSIEEAELIINSHRKNL